MGQASPVVYLIWQLPLADRAPDAFDRTHLMIHAVAVTLVGLAGGWIYSAAFRVPRWSETDLDSSASEPALYAA